MTNWQHLLQLVQCIGICCNMLSFSFKVDLISLLISALKISLDHTAVLKGPQASIYFLIGFNHCVLQLSLCIRVYPCNNLLVYRLFVEFYSVEVTSRKSLLLLEYLGKRKCNMIFQIFLFQILISKSHTKIRESRYSL